MMAQPSMAECHLERSQLCDQPITWGQIAAAVFSVGIMVIALIVA